MNYAQKIGGSILKWQCDLCRGRCSSTYSLCDDCASDLPHNTNPCPRCGLPMPAQGPCTKCSKKPGNIDCSISAFRYCYPVDTMIKKFKYNQILRISKPLVNSLHSKLVLSTGPLPEVMIPVPLHFFRMYSRGFNQSLEICKILRGWLGIPIDTELVYRTRDTTPMINLTARQRQRNVLGAFALKKYPDYDSLAIVDDVITTGSTANEIAGLFKDAGVKHIQLWSLAHAEH